MPARFVLAHVREGAEDALMDILKRNLESTASEPGCRSWARFSVRGQADAVAMWETYDDDVALAAHDDGPVMAEIRSRLGELLAGEPLIVDLDLEADIRQIRDNHQGT